MLEGFLERKDLEAAILEMTTGQLGSGLGPSWGWVWEKHCSKTACAKSLEEPGAWSAQGTEQDRTGLRTKQERRKVS